MGSYGDGTAFQRPNGTWEAQASRGRRPDGSRERVSATGATRTEAKRNLAEKLRQPRTTRQRRGGETVEAFMGRWLEDVVRLTLRDRTYWGYRSIVEHHVAGSPIASVEVASLARRDVQAWVSAMDAAPMTVRHRLDCLRSAMRQAVRWDVVRSNPCTGVVLPAAERKSVRAVSPAEARRIEAACAGRWIAPLVTVALWTGLRQGELLGMRWEDVSLPQSGPASVTVRHTLERLPGSVTGTIAYVPGTPKTRGSARTVVLAAPAAAALRERRKEVMSGAGSRFGLVWTNPAGLPVDGPALTKEFQAALAAAGVERMRWHDLRHAYVTLMMAAGVPLAAVSKMVGHSSIAITTDIYGHLTSEMQEDAVGRMERLMAAEVADSA